MSTIAHLAKPGRILDVWCKRTSGDGIIVQRRWIADCPACLAASAPLCQPAEEPDTVVVDAEAETVELGKEPDRAG